MDTMAPRHLARFEEIVRSSNPIGVFSSARALFGATQGRAGNTMIAPGLAGANKCASACDAVLENSPVIFEI